MSKETGLPASMASNTFVADPRKAELQEEEDIAVNPLARLSYEELKQQADDLAGQIGDSALSDLFMRAVTYAVHPTDDSVPLSSAERAAFDHEATHKWSQSRTFWYAVGMACMGAIVHGVDQTVINGANLFYPKQFGIQDDQWILGLVNGAPYLCCFTVGTWSCEPLNNYFGRRGAIFVAAFFCFFTFIWMAVCDSWQLLFAARFFLGFGHGIKAATVPVYVAECAPPLIRGACTMTWQLWTCVGIVFGTVINLAFKDVPNTSKIVGLNWRLMFGMASIFGIILMIQIFTVPESPRWLVGKNQYAQAWTNMKKLRQNDTIAARDLYQIDIMLKEEARIIGTSKFGRFVELFTVPRNARATLASMIIFLGQNLCGLVTIAYYSSTIFEQAGFSITSALVASLGFSLIMLLFAFPAIWTIDTFGRRPLLLWTYPVMFLMSLMTGLAFYIPNDTARLAVVALGIYIFTMGYGPGQGTTPFVYAAEAFPLRVRNLGMALATAWAFFCSFFVSLTFPVMLDRFGKTGAFGFYAGWDFLLFFLILLFVPETKALALEELDNVFEVPTKKHAAYQIRQSGRWIQSVVFRQDVEKETLYPHERVAVNAQSG